MERKIDVYDKTDIYEKYLLPLIQEFITTAKMYDIPVFVTAAVKNDEEKTVYKSDVVLASTEMTLFENRIANLLFLLNGFTVDAPEDIKSMYRELLYYLKSAIPDAENMLDIKLKTEWISSLYKASCHSTELRFPKKNHDE